MTETQQSPERGTSSTSATSTGTTTSSGRQVGTRAGGAELATSQGKTTIADTVVAKIAGIAAREVNGVHALGGGAARAVGAIRERIPGSRTNLSQGVAVEVGERQTAVDIDIVADYGVAIADLAAGIRRNVIDAVERMTSLEVTEVNVTVHDVYLETGEEEQEQPAPARVQ
jgi:uncharacterized alkaline shock family protein YloU